MGTEEEGSGVLVRGDALEQGQGVANAVRGVGRQSRRGEEGIDGNNLLEKSGHGAKGMPKDGGQVFAVFPLFRQFQEDVFALFEMESACNAIYVRKKKRMINGTVSRQSDEAHDALGQYIAERPDQHARLACGVVTAVMTDAAPTRIPSQGVRSTRPICFISSLTRLTKQGTKIPHSIAPQNAPGRGR